jgi:hypothetical protein
MLDQLIENGLRGLLGEFIREIDRRTEHGMLFRGVSSAETHRLIPSVGRLLPTYERSGRGKDRLLDDERDALQEFAEKCPQYPASDCADEFELMLLAQHHGLPTRMLDWTFNPLVALFFAVSKDPREDGAVFVLSQTRTAIHWRQHELDVTSPFAVPGPTGMLPRHKNARVAAQDGVVIIHQDPTLEFDSPSLHRVVIPADDKIELEVSLRRSGVHDQTLFPGLDGLARRIRKRAFTSPEGVDWWERMRVPGPSKHFGGL